MDFSDAKGKDSDDGVTNSGSIFYSPFESNELLDYFPNFPVPLTHENPLELQYTKQHQDDDPTLQQLQLGLLEIRWGLTSTGDPCTFFPEYSS